jgi:transcriptional regulator with XRE-family HTH domain
MHNHPMPKRKISEFGLTARERAIIHRVRAARHEMQLSQEQVAQCLGITKAGYGHYEREAQPFAVEQLFALSDLLGRPMAHFLGLEGELTEEEGELLQAWRSIKDDRMRALLLNMAHQACRLSVEE